MLVKRFAHEQVRVRNFLRIAVLRTPALPLPRFNIAAVAATASGRLVTREVVILDVRKRK